MKQYKIQVCNSWRKNWYAFSSWDKM